MKINETDLPDALVVEPKYSQISEDSSSKIFRWSDIVHLAQADRSFRTIYRGPREAYFVAYT
jgi:hypothetical protein